MTAVPDSRAKSSRAGLYGFMNLISVVAIVIANKQVMSVHKFAFPVCLALLHSVFTALGMQAVGAYGMFEEKRLPWRKTLPIALAYAGYIWFNNLSLQVNTVGFHQISRIAILPVVVAVERILYAREVTLQKLLAIACIMVGISVATVTDTQVSSNPLGVLVAVLSIASSVAYTVWAGASQKELDVTANQLLHQVAPLAVVIFVVLTPLMEPVGLDTEKAGSHTILSVLSNLSPTGIVWLVLSCVLGLAVTLSTYLVIGAVSITTFSVLGHVKTACILGSGVILFGDSLTPIKLMGLGVALAGIAWYSTIVATRVPVPADTQDPEAVVLLKVQTQCCSHGRVKSDTQEETATL